MLEYGLVATLVTLVGAIAVDVLGVSVTALFTSAWGAFP